MLACSSWAASLISYCLNFLEAAWYRKRLNLLFSISLEPNPEVAVLKTLNNNKTEQPTEKKKKINNRQAGWQSI